MKKFFVTWLYPLYLPLWLLFFATTTAFFAIIVILMSFIPGVDTNNRFGYFVFARFWAWLNLGLTGTRVSMHGKEKIDRSRSYIVMSNHQSHFDVLALIAHIPLQLRWVMKIELRPIPIFGIGCEKIGMIYVDRGDREKARESLKAAKAKIDTGVSVMFFPEGTRSEDGKLQEFKRGGFVMAIETETPILPITVNGGRFALPKRKPLSMKPGKIEMIIHEPVEVKGLTYDDRHMLIDRVRDIIEGKIDLEYGKPF
jgi:1-acyl-sn-glycerol-3-phosphate acyltransferase